MKHLVVDFMKDVYNRTGVVPLPVECFNWFDKELTPEEIDEGYADFIAEYERNKGEIC